MFKASMYNVLIKREKSRCLVFNTNSQALCWLHKKIYEQFSDCMSEDVPTLLKDYGYVVDSNEDEFSRIELEKNVFVFDKKPDTICFTIVPTTFCNMHCEYCFENNAIYRESISEENIDILINFIFNQIENNGNIKKLYIKWFGGEPSLEVEKICGISKRLIDYCKNRGISYSSMMISNGYLLDKKIAAKLKGVCKINKIQITIDGFSEYYANIRKVSADTFDTVIENIENICDIINVTIRINCSKDNLDKIGDLATYILEKKGLSGKIKIYFARVKDFEFNNSNVESELAFEQFNKKICFELAERGHLESLVHSIPERNVFSCGNMQMNSAVIGPDLSLYRCDDYIGKRECAIGNCKDGFFHNALDCRYLNCQYHKKCRKCAILPICGGGCLHERIEQKKEIDCKARLFRLKTTMELHMLYKEHKKGGKMHV